MGKDRQALQDSSGAGIATHGRDATRSRSADADPGTPPVQGLYHPALDKDACGVGFIADIKGRKSHQIVEDGLRILNAIWNTAARSAPTRAWATAWHLVDPSQILRQEDRPTRGIKLPKPGEYAIGYLFMPRDSNWRQIIRNDLRRGNERQATTAARLARGADRQLHTGELVPSRPSPCTCRCSSASAGRRSTPNRAQGSISCASRSPTPSTRGVSGAHPAITRCRSPSHGDLQGHVPGGPTRRLLPRPARSRLRERARARRTSAFSTNTFPTWSLAYLVPLHRA